MSSSSSGNGAASFALLNGDAADNPAVVASFRVGDNSMWPGGVPEFMVRGAGGANGSDGHITWDPDYDAGGANEFTSVAPVRMHFDVGSGRVQWSVGTTDFISCDCDRFHRITKLQVTASTATDAPECLVQWDVLRLTFRRPNGTVQCHASPCLPRASSRSAVRRATADAAGPVSALGGVRQQYAEIVGPDDAVAIGLIGQVTLRARGGDPLASRLSADSLQGNVLIFAE
jgi:hypothetical protein